MKKFAKIGAIALALLAMVVVYTQTNASNVTITLNQPGVSCTNMGDYAYGPLTASFSDQTVTDNTTDLTCDFINNGHALDVDGTDLTNSVNGGSVSTNGDIGVGQMVLTGISYTLDSATNCNWTTQDTASFTLSTTPHSVLAKTADGLFCDYTLAADLQLTVPGSQMAATYNGTVTFDIDTTS